MVERVVCMRQQTNSYEFLNRIHNPLYCRYPAHRTKQNKQAKERKKWQKEAKTNEQMEKLWMNRNRARKIEKTKKKKNVEFI